MTKARTFNALSDGQRCTSSSKKDDSRVEAKGALWRKGSQQSREGDREH